MNYNIKGTGLEVSDELRSYAEKKLAQADKFVNGDTTAHADIELELGTDNAGPRYRAEFTVSIAGEIHRTAEWGSGLHEAMDLAAERLVQEMRQSKKKRLHVFRHSAVRVKEYLRGWRGKI